MKTENKNFERKISKYEKNTGQSNPKQHTTHSLNWTAHTLQRNNHLSNLLKKNRIDELKLQTKNEMKNTVSNNSGWYERCIAIQRITNNNIQFIHVVSQIQEKNNFSTYKHTSSSSYIYFSEWNEHRTYIKLHTR